MGSGDNIVLVISAQTPPEEVRRDALALLRQHGFGDEVRLSILRGGANNRVYLIEGSGRDAVLKSYFQHPGDDRDRFQTERSFYEFLQAGRIPCVPEPFGWDSMLRLGLFARISGRKLASPEVDQRRVAQAAEFVLELNLAREMERARRIPKAAEACFAISEHIECVEQRVERLRKISSDSKPDADAAAFVREQIAPSWSRVRQSIEERVVESRLSSDQVLAVEARVLSPSDFGFHNALLTGSGALCFFDFEYAGWDDPAKLICDFFCQPELPVPTEFREAFAHRLVEALPADATLSNRWRLLFPAYQIKWCCILLNEFVRGDSARRDFATGGSADRKAGQLEKARRLLGAIGKE